MSLSTFRRTIVRWRARVWHILPILALAVALTQQFDTPPPPTTDKPSQGDYHRARPQVNWNS
jgi:hypothetical protein